jgi:hypothetical protein
MTVEKKSTHAFKIWSDGASNVERDIAKKHGQKGPKDTFCGDVGRDIGSSLKAHAEGAVTGVAAGALGFKGAKALAQRALNRGATNITRAHKFAIGTGLGSYFVGQEAGKLHSYHRQGKKMEKKYQEKAAHAVNMLIDQGVDFETAADLVMEKVAFNAAGLAGDVAVGAGLGAIVAGKGHRSDGAKAGAVGGAISHAAFHVTKNPYVALGGLVGTGYAAKKYAESKKHEKQAAVNALVDNGIDFDTAVDLVESKAQELYGD